MCGSPIAAAIPTKDIALDDDDLLRAAKAELFFHSHPDGVGCPSESDMRYQQQLAIPFVVMVWPLYDCFWWGDQLTPAPLLGRGFRHGVHDCYSLLRDYYVETLRHHADRPAARSGTGGTMARASGSISTASTSTRPASARSTSARRPSRATAC